MYVVEYIYQEYDYAKGITQYCTLISLFTSQQASSVMIIRTM